MTNEKRLIRILVTMIILCIFVPCSHATTVVGNGECGADGDNLTWTLDSDGVLTISGEGKMISYPSWDVDTDNIKSVRVNSGVTCISNFAFDSFNNLISVTIPETVTSIGNGAFYKCGSLKNILIPEGVECIGTDAFRFCNNLERVCLPSTVRVIDIWAFSNCGRIQFTVDDKNEKFSEVDGVLFNKDKTTLVCYAKDKIQNQYAIPDGVDTIGESAFYGCPDLSNLYIPESVSNYWSDSFNKCGRLSINVSQNNPKLSSQDGVLFNKDKTRLIRYAQDGSSYKIPDTVTEIFSYAFCDCSSLTDIYIPNCVNYIGRYAFSGCRSLTNIKIPNGITNIENSTFRHCSNLKYVKIPDSVNTIGSYAFAECDMLNSVYISNSLENIEAYAFYGSEIKNVYFAGTEEEWKTIKIGVWNDLFSNVHYSYVPEYEGAPTVEISNISTDVNTNTVYADFKTLSGAPLTYTAICAIYNEDGTLIDMKATSVNVWEEDMTKEFVFENNWDMYELFAWGDLDGLFPLCASKK